MNNEKNPFEHILYEVEMYLLTYKLSISTTDPLFQFKTNFLVDSRAIHLRNLAYFFNEKKSHKCWHISDYISDINNIKLLDDALFKKVNRYTSQATGHLTDARLSETYKTDTAKCYQTAFPHVVEAINSFFTALEKNVKPEYKNDWEDPEIQKLVSFVKNQLLPNPISVSGMTGTL